jgi:uncharacterized membrane protein YeaQ/YmgE (transglycosylase-associated protein family)
VAGDQGGRLGQPQRPFCCLPPEVLIVFEASCIHKMVGAEMSVIGWIVLGLIAGFIASKIVSGEGLGFFLNIFLGVIGALVGGWLFRSFGERGLTGFSFYSMFVAIIGAVVVLLAFHAVRRIAS